MIYYVKQLTDVSQHIGGLLQRVESGSFSVSKVWWIFNIVILFVLIKLWWCECTIDLKQTAVFSHWTIVIIKRRGTKLSSALVQKQCKWHQIVSQFSQGFYSIALKSSVIMSSNYYEIFWIAVIFIIFHLICTVANFQILVNYCFLMIEQNTKQILQSRKIESRDITEKSCQFFCCNRQVFKLDRWS